MVRAAPGARCCMRAIITTAAEHLLTPLQVLEELDNGGEFFTAAGKVYIKPNVTGDAWQKQVVVGVSERLVSLIGTQEKPVAHLHFNGITFTQSLPTFLGGSTANRSMAPGTGDWSIFNSGAMYLSGTEHIEVANCTFREIGGNGVFMYGYNRWNTVAQSEFVWLGDSAVALVGVGDDGLASVSGLDGNFPSDNTITRNHIHENGVLTKQSSPYFQTVACHNNITYNVMYNGPRAGINFVRQPTQSCARASVTLVLTARCLAQNDGFGGGDLMLGNIIFNMVRETK